MPKPRLRPTKKAERCLSEYIKEVNIRGRRGSIVRAAKNLRVSKQCVHQTIHKFSHKIPDDIPEPIKMFTCKVCSMEMPVTLKVYGACVCRDCNENHVAKCTVCGTRFIFDGVTPHTYCRLCYNIHMCEYMADIRKEGGDRYEKLKERQHKAQHNYKLRQKELTEVCADV